jgi:hypothetical protein
MNQDQQREQLQQAGYSAGDVPASVAAPLPEGGVSAGLEGAEIAPPTDDAPQLSPEEVEALHQTEQLAGLPETPVAPVDDAAADQPTGRRGRKS